MLRSIVALLIVANLGFFAWSQGWLSPWLLAPIANDAGQREPQRLQAQINPQAIRIAGDSNLKTSSRVACVQAGPFNEAAVQAAEAALRDAALHGLTWQREPAFDGRWWLRLPRATAEHRAAIQALPDATLARGFQPCV